MRKLAFDCQFRYPQGFRLAMKFTTNRPVTAIIGPSGCGKTTVLNLIGGILKPDQGRISFGDTAFFDSNKSVCLPIECRNVGFVFHDFLLFPHLTVQQNLRFGIGETRADGDSENGFFDLDSAIDRLGLSELLPRYPATLSAGQQQRVAIARALAARPQLLLMDEPFNALNEDLKQEVVGFVSDLFRQFELTTIIVSHDLDACHSLDAELVTMQNVEEAP